MKRAREDTSEETGQKRARRTVLKRPRDADDEPLPVAKWARYHPPVKQRARRMPDTPRDPRDERPAKRTRPLRLDEVVEEHYRPMRGTLGEANLLRVMCRPGVRVLEDSMDLDTVVY